MLFKHTWIHIIMVCLIHAYLFYYDHYRNDDNIAVDSGNDDDDVVYYYYQDLIVTVAVVLLWRWTVTPAHSLYVVGFDLQNLTDRPQQQQAAWCKGNYFDQCLQDVTASSRASLLISTWTFKKSSFLQSSSFVAHNLLYNLRRVL